MQPIPITLYGLYKDGDKQMIDTAFDTTKVFTDSRPVGTSEACFNLFQYCANSNAEDIDAVFNAVTSEFDSAYRRSGFEDRVNYDNRVDCLSSIFGVFDNIRDMSEDVERMVEAAKFHASVAYKFAEIQAITNGLSIQTYRAMTAQRIINWGK